RRRRGAAAAMLLLACLVILPVTWHNVRACGRLVWISANGGINFFIGNNPDMHRTVPLRPGPEWRRMNDLPLREAGLVHPAERDRWFYREGLRFWRESPGVALRHTFEKGMRLLHNHESMRDFDFYYFAQHYSRLLRLPRWNFALLLALALVGIAWGRNARDTGRVLQLFLLSYAAGIVLFFVSSRYRAPLLPALAVFAAAGSVWLWRTARQRAWRPLLGACAAACLTFTLSSIDWFGAAEIDEVQALYRVGSAHQKRGDCDAALSAFEEALRLNPAHALAAARAAACEQQMGRVQAAVRRYEAVIAVHPDYVEPMVNLANIAWQHGDTATAAHYFELAIRADPWFAQGYAYYGLFMFAQGEPVRAVALLQRALQYDPGWEALRVDLARALVAAERPRDALEELQRARSVMPPSDASELVRGDALARLGRDTEARAAWEAGLRLNPTNLELQQRLRPRPGGR
ncbi:MAG: tetratricopeptide repeat protein, partial [Candidatus Latescibacterota bacterium]